MMRDIDEISDIINDLDVPSEYYAGSSALYVCILHSKSISILIKSGLYPSAYSLIRIAFESYILGRWLLDLADEKSRGEFVRGKKEINIHNTIYNIKRIDPIVGGFLLEFWEKYGRSMHSYTHSGHLTLTRLIGANYIGWEPDHDEISGVISTIKLIVILAVSRVIDLLNPEQNQEIIQRLASYTKTS